MNEILELLKQALEKLNAKAEVARKCAEESLNLKESLRIHQKEANHLSADLASRIEDLNAREAKIKNVEDLEAAKEAFKKEREAFRAASDKEAKAQESDRAKLTEDQGQVVLRKKKLDDQSAALEKEKAEYQQRIKDEFMEQLKAK